MQAGWVKISDFRQIAGYYYYYYYLLNTHSVQHMDTHIISKTVQDRHMVSIKVEQQVVFALSNSDIADDCE